MAVPTPRDFAVRTARPDTHPGPSRQPRHHSPTPIEPIPVVPGPWDRSAYETAVRFSELHPYARLLAFVLAHYAARTAGFISAEKVPEFQRLAKATGMQVERVQRSIFNLERNGWVTRPQYDANHRGMQRSITLTIPLSQHLPRD